MEFAKRRIGRTAVEVTIFGLGCATLGGRRIAVTREEAEAIAGKAWEVGIRYVDAAPYYGYGQAERAVGDALRMMPREEWVLSTKVGRLLRPRRTWDPDSHPMPFEAAYDYSYDGVMRSFEDSLQRLGLSRIDILYVHDIGAMQHGKEAHPALMRTLREGGWKALAELRRGGLVRAIGIGVNEKEVLLEAIEWGDWDVFLLAGRYTLLEQAPVEDLLPKCAAAGISIVVGGPFNSGILAGRNTWNYETAPAGVIERAKALRAVCGHHGVPLASAALQFPLAHPAVAAVIPGPRNAAELEENVTLFRRQIPAALWQELRTEGLIHPAAPTPS